MRTSLSVLAAVIAISGCSGGTASSPSSGSAVADLDTTQPHATAPGSAAAAPGTPAAKPDPAAPAPAGADGAKPTEPPKTANADGAKPAPPAPPLAGQDFIDDAKLLFRVAACGNPDTPLPEELGGDDAKAKERIAKVVDQHCKYITDNLKKFRAAYFEKHRAWFEAVVPKEHKTVVYPFGGGDLLSALVAFPDATEITTISLEQAGDPRRLRKLKPAQIEASLGALRSEIGGLISVGSNTSENLSKQQENDLPGQVSSFLLGLAAGGYEPVSMRFFTIQEDGELKYLEKADIESLDATPKKSKKLKHDWKSPNFSEAFQHVELQYRKPGEPGVRVHRHIGWNLGDDYLKKHPELLRHLEKKGKVVMLTKGASYLLWRWDFTLMRKYMLEHLTWMLSDSTGIPPQYAKGMVQETYGTFTGAFLEGARDNKNEEAFVELWRKNPRRALGFRFGYVDKDGNGHLVVTKPKAKP